MSNKTMTLTDIEKAPKEFKDTHTVSVGGFGKNKITLEYVLNEMRKGFAQVNARIDKLELRIDNLVAKNNLKE